MSASQRRKGANGEIELGHILTEHLGRIVKRLLGQARDGGVDFEVGKFKIDAKRCQTLAVPRWMREVETSLVPGDVGVVAFRRNGERWFVVLPLDDFMPLMAGELVESKGEQ